MITVTKSHNKGVFFIFLYSIELKQQETKVKERIWEEFHVHVDEVLQGKGKTNTGGIAKRLLSEPQKLATALELDVNFVTRLAKILSAMSCREAIDIDKLEEYCLETNSLFYQIYHWAEMRPTVHKFLVHGCQIIRQFRFPQLFYAEDGLERWHQSHRKNSREHSRQSSRLFRLTDMFNYAIYSTDPAVFLHIARNKSSATEQQHRYSDISEFLLNNDIDMVSITSESINNSHNSSIESDTTSQSTDNEADTRESSFNSDPEQ